MFVETIEAISTGVGVIEISEKLSLLEGVWQKSYSL
jgi:hypothetical protein